MHEYATTPEKCTDVRPTYIVLVTDADGADHIYRTDDETVHVVTDAGRDRVEQLGARSVDEWITFVDERRGWRHRSYGRNRLADVAAGAGD